MVLIIQSINVVQIFCKIFVDSVKDALMQSFVTMRSIMDFVR